MRLGDAGVALRVRIKKKPAWRAGDIRGNGVDGKRRLRGQRSPHGRAESEYLQRLIRPMRLG